MPLLENLSAGGLLLILLLSTSCKKETDSPPAKPTTPTEYLRVHRYTTSYDGTTESYTYTYDAQQRLDSVSRTYRNVAASPYPYRYTPTGFEYFNNSERVDFSADSTGRIVWQSQRRQYSQFLYDAAGRLTQVITKDGYNGLSRWHQWYAWDAGNNLLQESRVSLIYDTTGRWVVTDSTVTAYSGFTEVNTAGLPSFGLDYFGTASVNALPGLPPGARSGKVLPATSGQTYFRFSLPQERAADYTGFEQAPASPYTYTKDAGGRIKTVEHIQNAKPFTETYEYYD